MALIHTQNEGGVMESLFVILLAAIESNFMSIPFLQNWTEKLIDILESPPDWLIDLTMCFDSDEALNVLRKNLVLSGEVLDDEKYGGILVGFFYLSYLNKKISFQKFQSEILDVIDAYEIENLDIEEIGPIFETEPDIEGLLLKRFEKYGEKSNVLYSYLISQVERAGI